MTDIDRPLSTAKISNLIVPMIIGQTDKDYSLFIAYLLWRIPQIMGTIIQEYNDGARSPDDIELIEPNGPEEPPEPEPEFDEAIVTAHVLTVRNGPAARFHAIRYLRRNDKVKLYEYADHWAKISPDQSEWVSTTYLQFL